MNIKLLTITLSNLKVFCWLFVKKSYSILVKFLFIDGYTQCQEDMADKKYTEEDMYNCWQTAFTDAMNISKEDYKPIWYSDFINSLNKQD